MLRVHNNSYLGFWESEIVQEKILEFFERNADCMIVPGQDRLKDTSVLPWWRNTRTVKEKNGIWHKKQIRLSRVRSKVCQDSNCERNLEAGARLEMHICFGEGKKNKKQNETWIDRKQLLQRMHICKGAGIPLYVWHILKYVQMNWCSQLFICNCFFSLSNVHINVFKKCFFAFASQKSF